MNDLALDTTPLLWWLHVQASIGPPPKPLTDILRDRFLGLLSGRKLFAPAPAFAEALTQFPLPIRARVQSVITRVMVVSALDEDRGAILATVYDSLGGRTGLKGIASAHQSTRQRIKVDYQIIAIARSDGCDLLSADAAVVAAGPRVGVTTFDLYHLPAPTP